MGLGGGGRCYSGRHVELKFWNMPSHRLEGKSMKNFKIGPAELAVTVVVPISASKPKAFYGCPGHMPQKPNPSVFPDAD